MCGSARCLHILSSWMCKGGGAECKGCVEEQGFGTVHPRAIRVDSCVGARFIHGCTSTTKYGYGSLFFIFIRIIR
jgi:hypothetical protein